jgi:hypothetical protein
MAPYLTMTGVAIVSRVQSYPEVTWCVVPRLVETTQVETFSRKRSAKIRRAGPKNLI